MEPCNLQKASSIRARKWPDSCSVSPVSRLPDGSMVGSSLSASRSVTWRSVVKAGRERGIAVQEMIKEVDYYGNGKINYSEFLSATINVRSFMTE